MIIVTGGAGFIGSNIVKALNERGRSNILVVDNLKRGENLAGESFLWQAADILRGNMMDDL